MKIVYIGNFAPGHTERWYAEAFNRINGVDLHRVDRMQAELHYRHLERMVGDADLLLYTRSHRFRFPPKTEIVWRRLERKGTITAAIHQDIFRGISRRERVIEAGDPMFRMGHVFTPDRGLGGLIEAEHHWLPPAVSRDYCKVGDPDRWDGPRGRILFLGQYRAHACRQRQWFVPWLADRYGDEFTHVGQDSEYGPVHKNDPRLPDLVAAHRFVIGHSFGSGSVPWYWSARVPEMLGKGADLLHPRTEGLARTHLYPREWAWGDVDELEGLLGSAPESTAAERVEDILGRHTYDHRAAEILRVLGLAPAASNAL